MKILLNILKTTTLIVFGAILALTIGAYLNLPLPLKPLVVMSGSMEPKIPVGSIVLVNKKPTLAANVNYKTGDIITFKLGNELVSHRIANITTRNAVEYFQTKGDANKTPDSQLTSVNNVVGQVAFSIPYIGRFVSFVKIPLGFLLLIITPTFLIIISEIIAIIDELKNKRSKDTKVDYVKPMAMFFLAAIFIGSTHAFFSSVATSSNNTFAAAESFPQTATIFDSNPFTCAGGATNQITGFGSVTLQKDGTNLKVSAILTGATPSSSYDIWVNQDPGGCPLGSPSFPAAMTTDIGGNGSVSNLNLPLIGGATKFWISAVGGGQVLRSVAVSL